jgi:hypothetical protein
VRRGRASFRCGQMSMRSEAANVLPLTVGIRDRFQGVQRGRRLLGLTCAAARGGCSSRAAEAIVPALWPAIKKTHQGLSLVFKQASLKPNAGFNRVLKTQCGSAAARTCGGGVRGPGFAAHHAWHGGGGGSVG